MAVLRFVVCFVIMGVGLRIGLGLSEDRRFLKTMNTFGFSPAVENFEGTGENLSYCTVQMKLLD